MVKAIKKIFFLIFITNASMAQIEKYDSVIIEFQKHYNAENYDRIFEMFSEEMKNELPKDSANQFFIDLKAECGNMESREFVEFHQGTYANYRTKFNKAILSVNISIDSLSKVNGLYIKPYIETKDCVNALQNYPTKIAEAIYSMAKNYPNNTQISISIITEGKPSYFGVFKENDILKPTRNHDKIFEIGSITKVFTSTVLASLVEEGAIKLDDEINTYYPYTFKDSTKIFFKDLANSSKDYKT